MVLLSYKNEAIDARTFIFEERFTREMLHLIYNKILSDFTEKCEKKRKKGQGYKTRYLKKQRTKQYSISHRTNDVEKSEITKFCSLLKKKKPQHSIKSSKLQTSKAEFLRSHVSNYI